MVKPPVGSEHLLDWFHVTMRITVLGQLAKGLRAPPPAESDDEEEDEEDYPDVDVARELERLKWFLWHGNVFRTLETIEDLAEDLWREHPEPERAKLLKPVTEFDGYIRANAASMPSYAERDLAGEPISSACGVDGEPGDQQAHGQEAGDAVDPAGRPPSPPGPDKGAQRPARRRFPTVGPVVRTPAGASRGSCVAPTVSPVSDLGVVGRSGWGHGGGGPAPGAVLGDSRPTSAAKRR